MAAIEEVPLQPSLQHQLIRILTVRAKAQAGAVTIRVPTVVTIRVPAVVIRPPIGVTTAGRAVQAAIAMEAAEEAIVAVVAVAVAVVADIVDNCVKFITHPNYLTFG